VEATLHPATKDIAEASEDATPMPRKRERSARSADVKPSETLEPALPSVRGRSRRGAAAAAGEETAAMSEETPTVRTRHEVAVVMQEETAVPVAKSRTRRGAAMVVDKRADTVAAVEDANSVESRQAVASEEAVVPAVRSRTRRGAATVVLEASTTAAQPEEVHQGRSRHAVVEAMPEPAPTKDTECRGRSRGRKIETTGQDAEAVHPSTVGDESARPGRRAKRAASTMEEPAMETGRRRRA
jgi:hypothetical protein